MSLLETFRVLIPEFKLLSDEEVGEWLKLSSDEVTTKGLSKSIRDKMIVYLVAHNMVNAFRQHGVSGEVVSVSEGGLSITYGQKGTTGYYEAYQRLVKAHVASPITRCS